MKSRAVFSVLAGHVLYDMTVSSVARISASSVAFWLTFDAVEFAPTRQGDARYNPLPREVWGVPGASCPPELPAVPPGLDRRGNRRGSGRDPRQALVQYEKPGNRTKTSAR